MSAHIECGASDGLCSLASPYAGGTEGRDDRRAEFRETLDLLSRFTHQLRQEIARS